MTAKLFPPTELGPPALLRTGAPDSQDNSILGPEEDPECRGWGVASGIYFPGFFPSPAIRVADFQRLPDWTHHQEWSEGARARAQGGHGASLHLRPAGLWWLPWRWPSPAVGQGRFAAAAAAAVCECQRERQSVPAPLRLSICDGQTSQSPPSALALEAALVGGLVLVCHRAFGWHGDSTGA